jgi:putative sterol carrier protein
MPGALIPEKAQGVDAVIQFKFTGEEAGEWNATIKDGKVDVERGTHPSPRMTLTADSSDYVKIFTGELDGMQAFMQGKIKLAGDLNLAMKLMQMFKIR